MSKIKFPWEETSHFVSSIADREAICGAEWTNGTDQPDLVTCEKCKEILDKKVEEK